MVRSILAAVLGCALVPTIVQAQPYNVGDKVVVIRDSPISLPEGKVGDAFIGQVLQVGALNGKWLWVSSGNPGWLDSASVVPLDRRAIDRLTELIRAEPRSSARYSGRAGVWAALGELDIAIGDYSESIRLNPQAANYNNRGRAWHAKGEYDKAIADFNEALRIDPKYEIAYTNRGNAWQLKREYDKAIADYNETLRLDPKDVFAFNNRGCAWKAKGEYDKAIADLNETLRLDPKYFAAYTNRGDVWKEKGEYNKAIDDYSKAVQLNPKDSLAYFNRGISQWILRQPGSMDDFQQVLDLEGWNGVNARYASIFGTLAARSMNDASRAERFLRDSAGKLKEEWPYPAVRFLRGELDEAGLLALADTGDRETEARCYLGYDHLHHDRKEEALAQFRWIREKGNRTFTEHMLAIAELKRLEAGR